MNSVSPFRDLTKWPDQDFEKAMKDSSEHVFEAIRNGKIELIQTMLKDELYPPYEKLIETAINAGQREIVELLLQDESGNTDGITHHHRLILKAAKDKDIPVLRLLLKYLGSENIFHSVQAVIHSGNLSALQALLEAKVDANVLDGMALLEAVRSKHHEMLSMLIEHGADVNSTYGKAALSMAVTEAHSVMVDILLKADPNLQDPQNTILLDVFANRQYFLDRNVNLGILDALLAKQPNLQAGFPASSWMLIISAP